MRSITLLLFLTVCGTAAATPVPDYARKLLNDAKIQAVKVPRQAQVLANFAWPTSGTGDPIVMAAARHELVHFGHHGLAAIRAVIRTGPPQFRGDAVAALIQANRTVRHGMPQDLLPGLEEAVWYGSIEAQRLGMQEISRYKFPPSVLSIIDAVYTNPELAGTAIASLGKMSDHRARFFLTDVLRRGPERYRLAAAEALGRLGGAVLNMLRQETRSATPGTRQAAMVAFLPRANIDDVTILYEYLKNFPEDSTTVIDKIKARAVQLEAELESFHDETSASPTDGE